MHGRGFYAPFLLIIVRNNIVRVLNSSRWPLRVIRLDGMYAIQGERCIFLNVIFGAGGGIEAFLKVCVSLTHPSVLHYSWQ